MDESSSSDLAGVFDEVQSFCFRELAWGCFSKFKLSPDYEEYLRVLASQRRQRYAMVGS